MAKTTSRSSSSGKFKSGQSRDGRARETQSGQSRTQPSGSRFIEVPIDFDGEIPGDEDIVDAEIVDDGGFDESTWRAFTRTAASLGMSVGSFADWMEHQVPAAPAAAPMTAQERELIAASSGLSAAELADAERHAAASWQADSAAQRLTLAHASLTTKEAADRLGIGESAVRYRIRSGKLWATSVGGSHRIPSWQLTEGAASVEVKRADSEEWLMERVQWPFIGAFAAAVTHQPVKLRAVYADGTEDVALELRYPAAHDDTLPGIEQVVAAIPDDASVGAVQAFMTSPQEDLLVDGVPTTPVAWLSAGRNPMAVTAVLEQLTTVW